MYRYVSLSPLKPLASICSRMGCATAPRALCATHCFRWLTPPRDLCFVSFGDGLMPQRTSRLLLLLLLYFFQHRDGEDSPTTPLSIVSPEGPHENLQPAQVRGMTARLSPVDFVLAPPPESVPLADRSYESGCYRGHNSSLDLARMMVAVPDCFSPLSERFLNGRTASKGFVKGETAGLGDTLIGGIHMRRGYAGSRCEHLKHHCVGEAIS